MSLLIIIAGLPSRLIKPMGLSLFGISIVGMIATFIPGVGISAGGATRWINTGFAPFQPSELLKLTVPFAVAVAINHRFYEDNWKDRLIKAIVLILPMPLLLKQPDFGSFAIYTLVAMTLFFIFGMKWRYVIAMVVTAIPTFYFLVISVPYRRMRLMSFLDPWADPERTGFQVIQSLLSFSSGGLLGVGLGEGQGKLFFLPEAHTDFTLAVLGEEVGFVGFLFVLFMYGFIVLRGLQIAANTRDKFSSCIAYGLTVFFGLQVVTNVGVSLGLLPTKGLTLPFLSYGGSSLIVMGLLFGILLNIERSARVR